MPQGLCTCYPLIVSSCPLGLSLDTASPPTWSPSEHHLLSALPCHFKSISWFLPLLLMSGRCGPLCSGLPTGAWSWCLLEGRKAGVGGHCVWQRAGLPCHLETASSDAAGGSHSASRSSTTLVGWEMQHTKITRLKQLFCATAEQISHNKYRGKRWAFPGSLMGVGQSHPWVSQIQPSA